jgi:spoIIIJ-associated protein
MSDNIQELAIEKTKEFLGNLDTTYSEVSAEYEQETNTVKVLIQGDNLGMLIGYHGKNMESLKTILSLIINKQRSHEESVRLIVNVNDYSEKRIEQLKTMLQNAKTIMDTRSKSSYAFPPMSASDRRTLHTIGAEMGLKTESQGEGRDRHVVVMVEQIA